VANPAASQLALVQVVAAASQLALARVVEPTLDHQAALDHQPARSLETVVRAPDQAAANLRSP